MKVLLIDDHALFAKSLEIALEDYSSIDSLDSIQSVQNIMAEIVKKKPDIILMDINLNNISHQDGLLLTKNILADMPDIKIIILTGYDLPVYRYEAQKIGARGFINKTIEPDQLVNVLISVNQGSTYFPSEKILIEELTRSEKEILQLLSTGMKRKEIAKQLYLSERTVSNHIQHIFDKLQVTSSVEAITKGIQMGYIVMD